MRRQAHDRPAAARVAAALARLAAPHWPLLAVALDDAVVAVASAGYAKLIQLVMAAFERGDPSVIWWGAGRR